MASAPEDEDDLFGDSFLLLRPGTPDVTELLGGIGIAEAGWSLLIPAWAAGRWMAEVSGSLLAGGEEEVGREEEGAGAGVFGLGMLTGAEGAGMFGLGMVVGDLRNLWGLGMVTGDFGDLGDLGDLGGSVTLCGILDADPGHGQRLGSGP